MPVWWDTPWGVSLKEKFLPQNLQEVGYATAMFVRINVPALVSVRRAECATVL